MMGNQPPATLPALLLEPNQSENSHNFNFVAQRLTAEDDFKVDEYKDIIEEYEESTLNSNTADSKKIGPASDWNENQVRAELLATPDAYCIALANELNQCASLPLCIQKVEEAYREYLANNSNFRGFILWSNRCQSVKDHPPVDGKGVPVDWTKINPDFINLKKFFEKRKGDAKKRSTEEWRRCVCHAYYWEFKRWAPKIINGNIVAFYSQQSLDWIKRNYKKLERLIQEVFRPASSPANPNQTTAMDVVAPENKQEEVKQKRIHELYSKSIQNNNNTKKNHEPNGKKLISSSNCPRTNSVAESAPRQTNVNNGNINNDDHTSASKKNKVKRKRNNEADSKSIQNNNSQKNHDSNGKKTINNSNFIGKSSRAQSAPHQRNVNNNNNTQGFVRNLSESVHDGLDRQTSKRMRFGNHPIAGSQPAQLTETIAINRQLENKLALERKKAKLYKRLWRNCSTNGGTKSQ